MEKEYITKVVKDIGMTSLSRSCGNCTKIWYDTSSKKVFVRCICPSRVKKLSELSDTEIKAIYNDLKKDFE